MENQIINIFERNGYDVELVERHIKKRFHVHVSKGEKKYSVMYIGWYLNSDECYEILDLNDMVTTWRFSTIDVLLQTLDEL